MWKQSCARPWPFAAGKTPFPAPRPPVPGYEWTFRANAWAAGGRRPHSCLSSRRLTTWRARPRRNWWKPRMEGRAPRLAPCTPTATGLRDAGVLTQRAGRGHAGTAVDGAQRGPLAARGISLPAASQTCWARGRAFSRFQLSCASVGQDRPPSSVPSPRGGMSSPRGA